jgi:hypothetical protein
MTSKTRLAVMLAAAAALAAPAFAQQGTPPTPEQRAARFDAADANKDGKLDKAEFTASLPERAQANADMMWGRIDADGDGFVTKDQFMAMRRGGGPQPQ